MPNKACKVMDAPAAPNRGKQHPAIIAMCISHPPPRRWGLAAGRERAGKHCPVVQTTLVLVLHCPLPSRQSCLWEERPGHRASPSALARAGSQCLIPAHRESSNWRGCEMLGKINVGCGFINSLFLLRTAALSWAAKIWTLRAPLQGNFGACWHLFYREFTAFHPPEFLGRRILFRTFFSVLWIPIAHQTTQQQNWNQVQRGHGHLEFTATELSLFCSLPCRKELFRV